MHYIVHYMVHYIVHSMVYYIVHYLEHYKETVIDLNGLGLKHVDSAWSNKKEARASTARSGGV